MARLKDTYIEGDLVVEGSLLTSSLASPEGVTFPYIDKETNKPTVFNDRLVKFSNATGGEVPTPFIVNESLKNDSKTVEITTMEEAGNTEGSLDILLNQPGYKIFVKRSEPGQAITINFNKEDPKWFFPGSENGKY